MADPLGLISNSGGIDRPLAPLPKMPGKDEQGPGFEKLLKDQIEKVNQLQADAREAIEDLAAGRRDDVESILVATQKADTAFKLLLQVRNKVMSAYDEVKQIRL